MEPERRSTMQCSQKRQWIAAIVAWREDPDGAQRHRYRECRVAGILLRLLSVKYVHIITLLWGCISMYSTVVLGGCCRGRQLCWKKWKFSWFRRSKAMETWSTQFADGTKSTACSCTANWFWRLMTRSVIACAYGTCTALGSGKAAFSSKICVNYQKEDSREDKVMKDRYSRSLYSWSSLRSC